MFKDHSTEKLIEYIQTLPDKEQKLIIQTLTTRNATKGGKKTSSTVEARILRGIKSGLLEIKEAKRTNKKMKTLDEFLNEL